MIIISGNITICVYTYCLLLNQCWFIQTCHVTTKIVWTIEKRLHYYGISAAVLFLPLSPSHISKFQFLEILSDMCSSGKVCVFLRLLLNVCYFCCFCVLECHSFQHTCWLILHDFLIVSHVFYKCMRIFKSFCN